MNFQESLGVWDFLWSWWDKLWLGKRCPAPAMVLFCKPQINFQLFYFLNCIGFLSLLYKFIIFHLTITVNHIEDYCKNYTLFCGARFFFIFLFLILSSFSSNKSIFVQKDKNKKKTKIKNDKEISGTLSFEFWD